MITQIDNWQGIYRHLIVLAETSREYTLFACNLCGYDISSYTARAASVAADDELSAELTREFAEHIMHRHTSPADVMASTPVIMGVRPDYSGI